MHRNWENTWTTEQYEGYRSYQKMPVKIKKNIIIVQNHPPFTALLTDEKVARIYRDATP